MLETRELCCEFVRFLEQVMVTQTKEKFSRISRSSTLIIDPHSNHQPLKPFLDQYESYKVILQGGYLNLFQILRVQT